MGALGDMDVNCNLSGNSAQHSWRKKLHWLQWKYGAEMAGWAHALQFSLRLDLLSHEGKFVFVDYVVNENQWIWSWLMWVTSEAFLYFPCSLMCLMKSSRGSTDWSANGNLISFGSTFSDSTSIYFTVPETRRLLTKCRAKKKDH